MKLNLGCGFKKLEGYINVDLYPLFEPDLCLDLNADYWPIDDASVDEVYAAHVLEHLTAPLVAVMKNIYRVLKPGGKLHVRLPHPMSHEYLNDPTHVRAYMPETFTFFSKVANKDWEKNGWSNTPLGLIHDIDIRTEQVIIHLSPKWEERKTREKWTGEDLMYALSTYSNVCSEFEVIAFKPEVPYGEGEAR